MGLNENDLTNAQGWRPEPGDSILGTVTDVSSGYSDWSQDYYPIVTVQPEDGEPVAIHAFHAVLKSKLLALRPTVGDVIGVKYEGKAPSKDGKRQVASYVVKREGGAAGDPWAAFSEPERVKPDPETEAPVDDPDPTDIPF